MKRQPPLKIGDVFQGQFEIRRLLGAGGYGFVYQAYNRMMARDVALKLIETPTADRERRACLEARVIDRVAHPNVISGHGCGVWNDRWVYLELKLLRGRSLAQALQEHKTISVLEAFTIGAQIADGVHAAHLQGIIHRDLKPDNVFVESGGLVIVIDFGVAKQSGPDAPSTERDLLHGTGLYMCPEQLLTGTVTERSDLFSLGVILYEAIYGRCPALVGVENYGLKIMTENQILVEPPALHELMPWVPSYAGSIVQCLIAKNPKDRFESMAVASEVLRTAIARLRLEEDPRVSLSRDLSVAGQPAMSMRLVSSKPSTLADLRSPPSQAPTKPVMLGSGEPERSDSVSAPPTHTGSAHLALTVPVHAPRAQQVSQAPSESLPADDENGAARFQKDTAPLGSAFLHVVAPLRVLAPASALLPIHDEVPVAPPASEPEPAQRPELANANPVLSDEREDAAPVGEALPAGVTSRASAPSAWVLGVSTHRQAARSGVAWGSLIGLAAGVAFLALDPARATHNPRSARISPVATHTYVTAASPAQIATAAPLDAPGKPPLEAAGAPRPQMVSILPAAAGTPPTASTNPINRAPNAAPVPRSQTAAPRPKAAVLLRSALPPVTVKPSTAKVAARATRPLAPSTAASAASSAKPTSKSWIVVRGDDDVSWLPSSGLDKSPPTTDAARIFDKPLVPPK